MKKNKTPFILIALMISTTASAAEYCWTDYVSSAYFIPASNRVYCQNGDQLAVRNSNYKEGRAVLLERTVRAMKEKGYELLFAHEDGYSGTADDIFIKNFKPYRHYCKLIEYRDNFTLNCPKEDDLLAEGMEFSLASKNVNDLRNFLKAKGYEKIETAPAPVKPLHQLSDKYKGYYKSITLYGTAGEEDVCDSKSEALTSPFTMNCI